MHSIETIKQLNGEDPKEDFSQPIPQPIFLDAVPAGEERNRALMAEAHPYDVCSAIIAFENGELDEDETIEMFQQLVYTGLAWTLQGSYGRMATDLINQGFITRRG